MWYHYITALSLTGERPQGHVGDMPCQGAGMPASPRMSTVSDPPAAIISAVNYTLLKLKLCKISWNR